MRVAIRLMLVAAAFVCAAPRAPAQEFQPPSGGGQGYGSGTGFEMDLFSFSTRAGIDVSRPAQWVVGSTVDIAEMWSPRVRLRPSLEVSSDGSTTRLHWSGEIIYRFQPDNAPAIPYVGLGVGHMTNCAGCTDLWPTVVMGFELRFRPAFNWLIEYHALDRLGRHRFLIGLSAHGAGGS
ncbi:MAG TPA: hypothetical protein VEH83_08390 [Gemmatimonadales bacterium]|nr:hypothetical protein [Gemmatimonadales bacterium]